MSTIAILTAWRDHLELSAKYFEAVEAGQPDQLVIVDDGSDPLLPFAATRLDISAGFCTANNVGLQLVETDHVVLLNNDVELVRPTWLDEIRAMIEPGVLLGKFRYDPHGSVDGQEYPYVDGWCLAATTGDMRRLGGWDEIYDKAGPAYFSDNALSFHARMNGFRLRELLPGLNHLGGRTGGVDTELFQRTLETNRAVFEQQVREAISR